MEAKSSVKWSHLGHFHTIPSKPKLPFSQYPFLTPFSLKKEHYNFSKQLLNYKDFSICL